MKSRAMLVIAIVATTVAVSFNTPGTVKADPGYSGPTPTLGSVRWNLRGGEPPTGESTGGESGGGLVVLAEAGQVLHDDLRSRPTATLGANAFQGALSDNKVTYAEIAAMPQWDGNGTLALNSGEGIYLPAGATLDVRDAPEEIGGLRFLVQDDVVLLHGTIKTTRTNIDAVGLDFTSSCSVATSAVSIVFAGSMDLDGSQGMPGGNLTLSTPGTLIATGSVMTKGGKGNFSINGGAAGTGGQILFESLESDVILGEGSADTSGGKGAPAGRFEVRAAGTDLFDWGLRADGGNSSEIGGTGGGLVCYFSQHVEFSIRVIATGGNSPQESSGGDGGLVWMDGPSASGHLFATLSGGGTGGVAMLEFAELTNLEVTGNANGGAGGPYGGNGGALQIRTAHLNDCLLDFNCNGGAGDIGGGWGGGLGISAPSAGEDLDVDGLELHFVANGGSGGESGGKGGSLSLGGSLAASGLDLSVTVNAGIGNPDDFGGGTILISSSRDGATISGTMALTARGSSGGTITLRFVDAGGTFACDVVANAASTPISGAVGGAVGGTVRVQSNSSSSDQGSFIGSLDINVSGKPDHSDPESGMTGGWGGQCHLSCGTGGEFTCTVLKIDARGGASTSNTGGPGGQVFGEFYGDVTALDGHIWIAGGRGGSGTDGGLAGGNGGSLNFGTAESMIDLATTINAAGGNGELDSDSADFGGAGGTVTFDLNVDGDSSAGSLTLRANCILRGGNSTSGAGGNGGKFVALDGTATAAGTVTLEKDVNVNGGNAPSDGPAGGRAGLISVNVTASIIISGKLLANAGDGGYPGNATAANQGVRLGADRAASIQLTSTAVVRANGGTGGDWAPGPGPGGTVHLDPTGSGPSNPNLVEDSGSVVTANGTPPGVIYRD